MNHDPNEPKPSASETLTHAYRAVGLNWLSVLLLGIGCLMGFSAAVGESEPPARPCPGTGVFAAGCIIAAAILITRKPN